MTNTQPPLTKLQSLKLTNTTPVENANFAKDYRILNNNKLFLADKIKIKYNEELEGGGTTFGQRYQHVLKELYPNRTFENCFEWCSGPGFIGFDLLSRNLCQNLYLSDIFPPALRSIRETIVNNQEFCEDRVFFCQSKAISELPADWKFDLVVSNPPHWNQNSGQLITKIYYNYRITSDLNWELHNEFFTNIKKYLNPGAIILLQEQSFASGPDTFKEMIKNNGMYINDCYWEPESNNFYYLEVKVIE